ncbi:MAG: leucine-rich repeat protein [Clostridia bacterium]|nr:leucine-rich repeat protein [Clostridia bacterium]
MKITKRLISLLLAVLMIFGVMSVTAFAADGFSYIFSDDSQTTVYISNFDGYVPSDGYVEIPEKIDGYTVTGIAEDAFKDVEDLKGIIIFETLTYIDSDAFSGDVDIKIQKTEEPEDDFDTNDWFEDHKNDYVISGSTLVKYKGTDEIVTIPYNCSVIADGAFKNNDNIKVLYIEKELEKIGESAFEGCDSLENVVAGNGVDTIDIGRNAFKGTAWLKNYPSDLVYIGTTLVKYKGTATYVAIPNVFTAIAEEAFYSPENNGSIAFKIKVPYTVEFFGDDCFYLYDSITKVYPELVVFKDSAAAEYCEEECLDFTYAALPGDADRDGKTTAADARYVLRISAKLEKPIIDTDVKEVADITGDSKIAADDARLILRVAAKLDQYSADELLSMPRTDYELLFAASQALDLAKAYNPSYSKFAYQEISKLDMNTNSKLYFDIFKNELTPANKAMTVTYPADSQESHDNLFDISLIDAGKLKDYTCEIDNDVYKIKLVLKDETFNGKDVDANSFTRQMFPAETVAHFTNKVQGKYWYNDSLDYNMTYNNCTLELNIEIATLKIVSMKVTMNYDFSITGKLGGIKISGSNGPATATRTDVITYSTFGYFAK